MKRGKQPANCGACGVPADVVPFGLDAENGWCRYCAKDFERLDVIRAELRELLRPWYVARRFDNDETFLAESAGQAITDLENEGVQA